MFWIQICTRATIMRFDTHAGWWYKACPCCYKQLRKDENNDVLIFVKHNVQIPLPWFKVSLILEDVSDEISAIIIARTSAKMTEVLCNNTEQMEDFLMSQGIFETVYIWDLKSIILVVQICFFGCT
ncbi:uncharacterized protein LOC126609781 [Malus sylvestris]|uniref:uncharacterized protein LOC126609781 n=1 Tax=Malus sylvestris TaxID=3752 RepID=UPI0021ACBC1F|nr:uncharacterized protein LOC126609781 [Malus sylvestris]